MPLSTIFQLYRGSQFYWRNPGYPEKTTNLPQVRQTLSYASEFLPQIAPLLADLSTHLDNISWMKFLKFAKFACSWVQIIFIIFTIFPK
jgi:hypothetical protein